MSEWLTFNDTCCPSKSSPGGTAGALTCGWDVRVGDSNSSGILAFRSCLALPMKGWAQNCHPRGAQCIDLAPTGANICPPQAPLPPWPLGRQPR